MQANSETVSSRYCAYFYTTLSISSNCVLLLEIFGGVVRQRTIAGTKNSVGRVLRVVFHLEDRFGFLYFSENQTFKSKVFLEKK